MVRILASSLFRWLTAAAGGSRRIYSRRPEAEFPASSQTACRLLEGLCWPWIAGCASTDALRSLNNSVKLEDQHEISLIRGTSAPCAWRLSTKGRSRPQSALSGNARREGSKENVLAASGCF